MGNSQREEKLEGMYSVFYVKCSVFIEFRVEVDVFEFRLVSKELNLRPYLAFLFVILCSLN